MLQTKAGSKYKQVRFPSIGVVDATNYLCSVPIDHGSWVLEFRNQIEGCSTFRSSHSSMRREKTRVESLGQR
jgi:hypothetical protein